MLMVGFGDLEATQPALGGGQIAVEVSDVAATVERLRGAGVHFRSGVISGRGGNQAIVEDPSGNPIELFEPVAPTARFGPSS